MRWNIILVILSLSCMWFLDPKDCSSPESSVLGISQVKILECVATYFFRVSSWPRDWTHGSSIGRQIFLPLTHQGSPVEYYSAIKMNKTVSLLERWMDLESVIQRRKSEREKQRLNINVYMWDQEEWHRWPYLQSRNEDSDIETKCMVPRGKGLGWDKLEYWDWHIHTIDTMYKIDNCWEYNA